MSNGKNGRKKLVENSVGNVDDGDILIVEHNCENVTAVYVKDEEEKQKRLEYLRQLM